MNTILNTSMTTARPCVPGLGAAGDEKPFDLFGEGDALYSAMLESIRNAQHSIRMESYIFAADEIGRQFAQALAERAGQGVTVRLHVDAAGSGGWRTRMLWRRLREYGVQVKRFHRWQWRRPWRYNRRNHRKLLVVDAAQAYLGGFNIHRDSSRKIFGAGRWRDTHLGFSGLLAKEAAWLFDQFWRDRRRQRVLRRGDSMLLPNSNRRCRVVLHCMLQRALAEARSTVFATTPYYVPDHKTQIALTAAVRRGVDVRLLVPHKSDVRIAQWAAQAAYAELLMAGVRIFEYRPRMLHAKTIVIDQSWAMVGTSNLDYRSFFLNYELNLVSRNHQLAAELHQRFFDDLNDSSEVLQRQWIRRYWHRYLFESIGWMMRRWL